MISLRGASLIDGPTDTLLLALILLVLTIQLAVTFFRVMSDRQREVREAPLVDPQEALTRHNDRVLQFMASPGHETEIERALLIEASLAAKIDEAIDRLSSLELDELRARFSDRDIPRFDSALYAAIQKLKRVNAGAFADKLFDKVLGIINKIAGVPG